jgi:3-hydroxybutyryl-CoA dehydrogenase
MKTSQGFYSWTPESIKVERNRYDTILKAGLKIIQKDIEDICR